MGAPFITFLSDYGLDDDFVGVCHGVMAKICPDARVIDLTHGIRRHDIRAGAIILAQALAYLPVGVHLAVVDPGVGASRRAVALRLGDGRVLVGPDNGLLVAAAELGGGAVEAIDIVRSPVALKPLSATFHGRDIFAPVAAWLASGVAFTEVGDPCDPTTLVGLDLPHPRHEAGVLIAHVLHVDRFGNLQLDAGHEDLAASGLKLGRVAELEVGAGDSHRLQYVRTFAEADRDTLLLYEDAQGRLSIAVSQGDAAARLGLGVDDELRIRPA